MMAGNRSTANTNSARIDTHLQHAKPRPLPPLRRGTGWIICAAIAYAIAAISLLLLQIFI